MLDVVVLGEALVDIVRTPAGAAESPGGSPANVAVALGRLDRRVVLVTTLAADERGRRVGEWLAASGVETVLASVPGRTGTADALIGRTGDAEYSFDVEWNLPAALALPPARIAHTGSVAASLPPGADVVADVVETVAAETLVTFDPNIRPALAEDLVAARTRVERLVRVADVVKASADDTAWLYPGLTSERVARLWLGLGATLVVVTEGAEGALAAHGSAIVRVRASRVHVVDTVGAGDTFMGAIIDALLALGDDADEIRRALAAFTADDLDGLLSRGVAAAAVTVSRAGMDPPRRADLADLVRSKGHL
ncbi:carbohydrate kinase [Microbacterium sp. NIBRBAC000506063]|nr:carbohydrate kinase [Microbacterium sp. NIBRBAC000506063]